MDFWFYCGPPAAAAAVFYIVLAENTSLEILFGSKMTLLLTSTIEQIFKALKDITDNKTRAMHQQYLSVKIPLTQ